MKCPETSNRFAIAIYLVSLILVQFISVFYIGSLCTDGLHWHVPNCPHPIVVPACPPPPPPISLTPLSPSSSSSISSSVISGAPNNGAATIDANVVFRSYLRRMKHDNPSINFTRLLSKRMDVIIVWKIVLSNRWKVNMTLSASEITAFLNFSFPTYLHCIECQFWLWTSLGPDMFPDAVKRAFTQLGIEHFFYNPDAIAKLLLYKYFKQGQRLLTFIVDSDDFVEYDFFDKVLADVATRTIMDLGNNDRDSSAICYRPKEYLEFYAFEPVPRLALHRSNIPLRIMMGLYVQGMEYNDVLTMDHMKFATSAYLQCDAMVYINASAFYTRRLESSSAVLHDTERYRKSYLQGKEWNAEEKARYTLAF